MMMLRHHCLSPHARGTLVRGLAPGVGTAVGGCVRVVGKARGGLIRAEALLVLVVGHGGQLRGNLVVAPRGGASWGCGCRVRLMVVRTIRMMLRLRLRPRSLMLVTRVACRVPRRGGGGRGQLRLRGRGAPSAAGRRPAKTPDLLATAARRPRWDPWSSRSWCRGGTRSYYSTSSRRAVRPDLTRPHLRLTPKLTRLLLKLLKLWGVARRPQLQHPLHDVVAVPVPDDGVQEVVVADFVEELAHALARRAQRVFDHVGRKLVAAQRRESALVLLLQSVDASLDEHVPVVHRTEQLLGAHHVLEQVVPIRVLREEGGVANHLD
mmetsp:Transcript_3128/g.7283  ORF Transcript_3128/g.7283 Transcript_3128/m.7283 type:complete len:322 (-) Transcript_3128:812-1777(-)